MIHFPFRLKKKAETTLIVDVGTETVKSLLFEERGQEIKILGSSLEYFDRYGIFDSRDFETDVLKKAISRAIQNLGKGEEMNKSVTRALAKGEDERSSSTTRALAKGGDEGKLCAMKINLHLSPSLPLGARRRRQTSSIILGLPAHILKARVIRQSLKREESKKIIIDEKEEKEIFQKVLEKAKKNICQIYSEQSGILPEDIQFINLEILEIKIDGYLVPAIQKYEGKTLDFIILATFLPNHYLKKIKNIIESLGLTIQAVIQNAQGLNFYIDKTADKIFLDIGGTITQVFLVKGGVLEKIDEFPIGGQIFSKAISERLGLREAEARILKERYSKRELSKESSERIKEIIWFPSQVWFRNLKLKLKEMTARHPLPLNIVLFGGGSQLPDVQDILKKGEWESVSSGGKIEVQFFCPGKEDKSSFLPFANARVKEEIQEGIKILNSPQQISLLLMSYAKIKKAY